MYANSVVKAKKQDNPGMTKEEERKAGQQALARGRAMVGAKRETIKISDRQWEAIQAGAISENTLAQILRFADTDRVRPVSYTHLDVYKRQGEDKETDNPGVDIYCAFAYPRFIRQRSDFSELPPVDSVIMSPEMINLIKKKEKSE